MEIIDAFGLMCPKPLMLAKAKIDEGVHNLSVHVDNETAVKNVSRLAGKYGLAVAVEQIEGGWSVNFVEGDGAASTSGSAAVAAAATSVAVPACAPDGCGYVVFVGKDHVGEGDPELGRSLMKMALYTLSESDNTPASVLFMNGGVKLVAGEEQQVIDSVSKLVERGTEVLVCGTCLDFYGLKDQLKVGEVSNMYDILDRMQEASKTITL